MISWKHSKKLRVLQKQTGVQNSLALRTRRRMKTAFMNLQDFLQGVEELQHLADLITAFYISKHCVTGHMVSLEQAGRVIDIGLDESLSLSPEVERICFELFVLVILHYFQRKNHFIIVLATFYFCELQQRNWGKSPQLFLQQ